MSSKAASLVHGKWLGCEAKVTAPHQKYDYGTVNITLAEPNRQVCQAQKGVLFRLGFRNIKDPEKLDPVEGATTANLLDLLICDTHTPGGDICELVRKVRNHQLGNNPFIKVIVTTASPSEEIVRQAIDSGADDLLIKPFSSETLVTRIFALTDTQRPYVVTNNYIGPDRRNAERMGIQTTPLIKVPNILRLKASGINAPKRLQKIIDKAAIRINEEKLDRHATQVTRLVGRIVPRYEERKIDHRLRKLLDNLVFISEDISRRLSRGDYAHVAELADTLRQVAGDIRKTYKQPDQKDVRLLPELARAIEIAFKIDKDETAVVRDISQSIVRRKRA